ncbi:hypothetical protein [Rubritalea tangerina]|uniref:hypothetical protein n=1 Tax=Rubritalea tangerina TaxID=430798 RepID=UPI00360C4ED1
MQKPATSCQARSNDFYSIRSSFKICISTIFQYPVQPSIHPLLIEHLDLPYCPNA